MRYEIVEDYPGDKQKFGVDVIVINNNEYEFMAIADLWRPELQTALQGLPDNQKLTVYRRNGKIGYMQVKSCKP